MRRADAHRRSVTAALSLAAEVAVGEDDGRDERPDVEDDAHPARGDLHPHRRLVRRQVVGAAVIRRSAQNTISFLDVQ